MARRKSDPTEQPPVPVDPHLEQLRAIERHARSIREMMQGLLLIAIFFLVAGVIVAGVVISRQS